MIPHLRPEKVGEFINEGHLHTVSYGGAILVYRHASRFSHHHMFEGPSDEEDLEDNGPDALSAPQHVDNVLT